MFLIARGDEPVDFALQLHLLFVLAGCELRIRSLGWEGPGDGGGFTLYGAYHFARRVLPLGGVLVGWVGLLGWREGGGTDWRFWIRMKERTIVVGAGGWGGWGVGGIGSERVCGGLDGDCGNKGL